MGGCANTRKGPGSPPKIQRPQKSRDLLECAVQLGELSSYQGGQWHGITGAWYDWRSSIVPWSAMYHHVSSPASTAILSTLSISRMILRHRGSTCRKDMGNVAWKLGTTRTGLKSRTTLILDNFAPDRRGTVLAPSFLAFLCNQLPSDKQGGRIGQGLAPMYTF